MTILFRRNHLSYDDSITMSFTNLKEKLEESKKWREV